MALETLKGVTELGGFPVVVMDELREKYPERFTETGAMDHKWFEETIRPNNFVYVRHDKNSIAFTLQNGPIKENGVNGCQVDTLLYAAAAMLNGLNKQVCCSENIFAMLAIDQALTWLSVREGNRKARGVEGTNQV